MQNTLPSEWHQLIPLRAPAEEITHLIVDPTESRRHKPLNSTHRVSPVLNTSLILLEMVVQIAAPAMPHRFPQLSLDRPRA
jgi:hypothetical protein